jgi:hypothetical protein
MDVFLPGFTFFIFTVIVVIVVIVFVRPLFKRNIYLSLLYVIGLLLSKNLISFPFLPSMQLKHVILITAADIVHFSSHVL